MLFHVFSSPSEGDFLPLAEHLSCRLFRSAVGAVGALAARGGAVPPQIDGAAATPDRVSTRLWSPDVGHVLRGLSDRTGDHGAWLSAQLSLAAFTSGLIDDLEIELAGAPDRWLGVAGRSLRGDRLRFAGHAGSLVVTRSTGDTLLRLQRVDTEALGPVWTRRGGDDLARIGSASMAVLGGGEYIDQWETPEYELAPAATPGFRTQLEEATALLEQCLPVTYVWIAAVLREVGAFATPSDGTRSSSSVVWPGHVRMSVGAKLIQTINMLVHECCHQYFYLVMSSARVTRPNAPQVFSVLKQTARPFERVLLGFHAFGNVLLVHDALLDGRHPVDRGEVDRERAFTRQIVAGLDASLQGGWEQQLEEAGVELYLPLRRRLIEAGLLDSPRPASRVLVERALYRPEVFEYQRSLALGEPVDERALPARWCVLPATLLVALYWLFTSATYHPRARGTASAGDGPGTVVVSLAAPERAFADLEAGAEATIRIAGGAPHRMMVRRARASPCAASPRCVEIEARVDAPADSIAIPGRAAVPAEVVLSARSVIR